MTGLYGGVVYGAYSWIKVILQDIDRLKIEYANKIAALKAQIVALNMQINQEWIRINELAEYKELNVALNGYLTTVTRDPALNKFLLSKGSLDQANYYDYCGYYLKGKFNEWPFAEDIYRTEWYTETYPVYSYSYEYDYYGNRYTVDHIDWYNRTYSVDVYDHTDYFRVNGSVDKDIATRFCNLYEKKLVIESDYNNLLNQKSNLHNKVETMGSGVFGRIAGIVFISIASVLLTGLFVYLMFKLCQRTYSCYKYNNVSNCQSVMQNIGGTTTYINHNTNDYSASPNINRASIALSDPFNSPFFKRDPFDDPFFSSQSNYNPSFVSQSSTSNAFNNNPNNIAPTAQPGHLLQQNQQFHQNNTANTNLANTDPNTPPPPYCDTLSPQNQNPNPNVFVSGKYFGNGQQNKQGFN